MSNEKTKLESSANDFVHIRKFGRVWDVWIGVGKIERVASRCAVHAHAEAIEDELMQAVSGIIEQVASEESQKHQTKVKDLTTALNLWKQRALELEAKLDRIAGTPKSATTNKTSQLVDSARETGRINGR